MLIEFSFGVMPFERDLFMSRVRVRFPEKPLLWFLQEAGQQSRRNRSFLGEALLLSLQMHLDGIRSLPPPTEKESSDESEVRSVRIN